MGARPAADAATWRGAVPRACSSRHDPITPRCVSATGYTQAFQPAGQYVAMKSAQHIGMDNMPDLRVHSPLLVLGCLAALCGVGPSRAADTTAAADTGGPLQGITRTATRHEESLSKVPISVTALTQDAMDLRGIKDFQDIVRFTPGVVVDNSGTNNIAIRGIASTGGAGPTGIYLDDSPIQIRGTAFNPDDALPKTLDIDRIGGLRVPPGTLFGAGSEGGTVRYITTQPSLTTNSFYSREEVSTTQGGAISYEGGIAAGGPLVVKNIRGRLSGWVRGGGECV